MTIGTASAASPDSFHAAPAKWSGEWTLIVPFKGGPQAKSRIRAQTGSRKVSPSLQRELALGFLDDTVEAATAAVNVRRVIIVSSDPAAVVANSKVRMFADPGLGLNAAVEAGFAFARLLGSEGPVAALTADLPSLTAEDLDDALQSAAMLGRSVVSDRQGTGSTMITALPGMRVRAMFGGDSLREHLLAGHHLLAIPDESTLRADVDTIDDLATAAEIGVGRHTKAALLTSGLFEQMGTACNRGTH
ncbi:2-phospho-L-lactate guanylyltransferase [Paenarthrobacter nicotinovorans]|uniref:2-phospho-L-lactate guanylyltransferase n=1 Tax=Micrococcaceae TaxID=1268 RepID=UPI0008768DE7|nr:MULTISPECIES: 2-phospho-L-lactate guanylyltransferase [Micrococcaceae]MDR6438725.1 2-phospho-L-lactate guanylyltransferase [Paenarthrobacter nicotinovorans]SCZ56466.1 2-phospho-L-lactate guanylyltransferase [Arthrobacter sp. UNCCL28]